MRETRARRWPLFAGASLRSGTALALLLAVGAAPAPAAVAKKKQDVAVQFVTAANGGDYDTVCRLYSARYLKASQATCRWLYGWGAQLYGPYDYRILRQRTLSDGHRRIDLVRWHEPSFIELALERNGWRIVAGGW
jgi:hypothetical protein